MPLTECGEGDWLAWTIDFQPLGRRVLLEKGETLLQAARRIVLPEDETVYAPCGGQGVCGRCRVRITKGITSPPTDAERRNLEDGDLEAGFRLACQTRPLSALEVEIPAESFAGRQELQIEGAPIQVAPDPLITKYVLRLKASSLENPLSIWQQVEHLLKGHGIQEPAFDLDLIRESPALAQDTEVVTTVRNTTVINAYFGHPAPKSLGFAVDLGTTKLAGFLVDLESGATLASEGAMNPQIPYGEDVMSRLAYAMENDEGHQRHMAKIATDGINRLLGSLLSRVGAKSAQIEEVVVVGNTAMHHLFLRLPVRQLARSPYLPAVNCSTEIRARELGLNTAPGTIVHVLPSVAGFVGGDHVAMILSSRIHEASNVTLGLDIGTNTEIVLAKKGELISCSCPSGPAFEGAHIHQGMRAVDGAISRVDLVNGGHRVFYETIGNKPALGICGSGVLDAVAALVRHRLVNDYGILDNPPGHIKGQDGKRPAGFLLVPASDSGLGHDILLVQKDINEVQLAKAAIASGIELLLQSAGLQAEQIDKIVVAGAFGTHLRLESAITVGLLPDLPLERFEQIGNAAGAGARMCLISSAERKTAQEIARKIKYLELTAQTHFSGAFARALRFPISNETKR